jgi:hypothetical protein
MPGVLRTALGMAGFSDIHLDRPVTPLDYASAENAIGAAKHEQIP